MAGASERQEQRRREERERRRAEERAEQRREDERERRREQERELQREEERRAEALVREREFERAEQRAKERADARRRRLLAERRQAARTIRRDERRREAAREQAAEQRREAERAEERRAAAREQRARQEREAEREEERRSAVREEQAEHRREAEREEERRSAVREEQAEHRREAEGDEERRAAARQEQAEQRRDAEREQERRETARGEQVERRREMERDEERRELAREQQAEQRRRAERDEERRAERLEAARDEQAEQRRGAEREEERRAAARQENTEQRREAEREEERRAERLEAARDQQAEQRRGAERDEERRTERRAAAREQASAERRAAARPPRRPGHARLPSGRLSGSLGWLRARRRLILDEHDEVVELRGVTIRGLERAEPMAGAYTRPADEDELALLSEWGATAVGVPFAQDLALGGAEGAEAEDYLQVLDATVEAAAAAGMFTLLQLSLLDSRVPTGPGDQGDAFDPHLPDARSIDCWSQLAHRYRDEPAVVFDLFRSPHDPAPDDATATVLDAISWPVWRRWLLALLGEVRRAHPRALVVVRGLARGRDLSGFPLRYNDGSAVPNVIYAAELGAGDPSGVIRGVARLARRHPVGLLGIRPGPQDDVTLERLTELLARIGCHWTLDRWRDSEAPLVRARSRLHPTRLGGAAARGLALAPEPEASLDRSSGRPAGGHSAPFAAARILAQLLPGQLPPGPAAPAPPPVRASYVFYGYSGAPALPPFPNGRDPDQSFRLAALTLGVILRKQFPGDKVYVLQSWTKDKLIAALEVAPEPIRQVHVVTHGDSTRLSLAYHYGTRFIDRVRAFNAAPGSAHSRALAAMRDEDALVPGYLAFALEPARFARIRANHAPGAFWQIWGCFAGYARDSFGDPSFSAEENAYLTRFGLGFTEVDGIAVDIAKRLGVTCTAARDLPGRPERGLQFWHGTSRREVLLNDRRTPPLEPFWLWNVQGSVWVTYDPTGAELPGPVLLGAPRAGPELAPGRPPRWLTDAYWQ